MLLNKQIPFRFILNMVKAEILIFALYASLIYFLNMQYDLWRISMPLSVATILGTAISLLLAFRTNQAYDRWWEARKVWGAIVNDSRTLLRQLLSFPHAAQGGEGAEAAFIRYMGHRQIAWCYALGQSLRGQDTAACLQQFLDEKELAEVYRHVNRPNALLLLQSRDVKALYESEHINAYQQVQLEETLMRLTDAMGRCERIKNTVFPTTYSRFIDFFIYLFIILLPLGMVETYGIMEIPIVVLVAAAFFLIERAAIHMQDPFENRPTDTPVTSIARTIEINIRQMLGEQELPSAKQPEGYYVM